MHDDLKESGLLPVRWLLLERMFCFARYMWMHATSQRRLLLGDLKELGLLDCEQWATRRVF